MRLTWLAQTIRLEIVGVVIAQKLLGFFNQVAVAHIARHALVDAAGLEETFGGWQMAKP